MLELEFKFSLDDEGDEDWLQLEQGMGMSDRNLDALLL